MQTFHVYEVFSETAKILDRQRLGKQRVEAKQILSALLYEPNSSWRNHPAVLMWRGHEFYLSNYGVFMCEEWIRRGYKDNLLPWFSEHTRKLSDKKAHNAYPPWITPPGNCEQLIRSHRSSLVRKNPAHYRKYFPDVPDNLPYYWPVTKETLKQKENQQ